MMTAYNIHKEDLASVENNFSDFNKTFKDICDVFKDVTGKDIRNGDNARALQASSESLKQKIADREKPKRYFNIFLYKKFNLKLTWT